MSDSTKSSLTKAAAVIAAGSATAFALWKILARRKRFFAEEHTKDENTPHKPIRIYLDGCFDMMHYGHSNALRQARAVGDQLIVGLVSDEEIIAAKGSPPVMPEAERYAALEACKFVDEVIRNAPYDLHESWIDELQQKYKIDYIVHGDDPCILPDGRDAYDAVKRRGMFKMIRRTEGVSTTDIVGRMLLMTREHHIRDDASVGETEAAKTRSEMLRDRSGSSSSGAVMPMADAAISTFLPTSRRIVQFSDGRAPKPGDKIVYMTGGFDLFHAGHIAALKKAREFGDFLLVGVHTDAEINRKRGFGFPILNLHERVLSVLSCKHVDEVIIGAPWAVTEDMVRTMNISVVVRGTVSDDSRALEGENDAYKVPRDMGILKEFPSPSVLTVHDIIGRILSQREMWQTRFNKKAEKEADYHAHKEYVQEV